MTLSEGAEQGLLAPGMPGINYKEVSASEGKLLV